MHETRPRPRLPTGRLYQVPEQGQNQPEGDHGSTQGVYDGQKPSDGDVPSWQEGAGQASRVERAVSIGAFLKVVYLGFFIG